MRMLDHSMPDQPRADEGPDEGPARPPLPLHEASLWPALRFHLPCHPALAHVFSAAALEHYQLLVDALVHLHRAHAAVAETHALWLKYARQFRPALARGPPPPPPPRHLRGLTRVLALLQHALAAAFAHATTHTAMPRVARFTEQLRDHARRGAAPAQWGVLHAEMLADLARAWMLARPGLRAALAAVCDAALSLCYDMHTVAARVERRWEVYEAYVRAQVAAWVGQVEAEAGSGAGSGAGPGREDEDMARLAATLRYNSHPGGPAWEQPE
jgi:hypothetical protein